MIRPLLIAALLASTPAAQMGDVRTFAPNEIRVVDGNILAGPDGFRLRLDGIDAPEPFQYCLTRDNAHYRCGNEATQFLRGQVAAAGSLVCSISGRDQSGRPLGDCVTASGGASLSGAIVQAGWAIAYRKYSKRWIAAEDEARTAHRGIWQGGHVDPEQFRQLADSE